MKIVVENQKTEKLIQTWKGRGAFTLIELLVVISIIAILAALIIPLAGSVARTKKINTAQAEMQAIETALENYKAKNGVYPPSNPNSAVVNQLFYELTGVTNNNNTTYTTLDSASTVGVPAFTSQFNVGGVINSSKGSGEDTAFAKDFIPGIKASQLAPATNAQGILFTYLVTSVGGPDADYQPLPGSPANPFRYACPGTNNPNSYDLWIQLSINSIFSSVNNFKTPHKYLICNWSQQVQRNSPLP